MDDKAFGFAWTMTTRQLPGRFPISAYSVKEKKLINYLTNRWSNADDKDGEYPMVYQDYQIGFRYVDQFDSSVLQLMPLRRQRRWTRRVLEWLVFLALHNSYVLYSDCGGSLSMHEFILEIIRARTERRITHCASKHQSATECSWCARNGKRSTTYLWCDGCGKALHNACAEGVHNMMALAGELESEVNTKAWWRRMKYKRRK